MSTPSPKSLVDPETLEHVFRLFDDTKKALHHLRHEGTWAWSDHDEAGCRDAWHGGFPTAFAAMLDAVDPYLNPEDGEA